VGKRSALMALVMGIIPVVHAYLFYCWCNEAKVKWKAGWLNSTMYAAMFFLPIIQIYPLYRFFTLVESSLAKEGKPAYAIKPLPFALSFVLLPIWPLIWLYAVYSTQMLFNDNGVQTLG